MKEIKAFIHHNRIADVVHALKRAGFQKLSVVDVQGLLKALDNKEQDYSLVLGESVINEMKLELICEDARVNQAVQLIQEQARTGQADAGWIYVIEIVQSLQIEGGS